MHIHTDRKTHAQAQAHIQRELCNMGVIAAYRAKPLSESALYQ